MVRSGDGEIVSDDWVEIELEDDSGRSRARGRRTAHAAPAPHEWTSPDRAPSAARPGRVVLGLVAGAGAVAGSILTLLVSGTSGDDEPISGASTTLVDTTVPETTAPGPTLPEITAPRPTTTIAPIRLSRELGGPVLPTPTGTRLVGLSSSGDLVLLDLDSGHLDEIDVPGVRSGFASFVVPGSDRMLVGSWDTMSAYIVSIAGDSTRAPVMFSNGAQVLPGDRPDTAWVQRFDQQMPYSSVLQLVSFDGDVVAGPIDIAGGWTNWGDQRGGVIVEAPGGSYAVNAGGAQRLTPGRVLAVGVNHVLVKECDDALHCTTAMIERDTDTRSELPPGVLDGERGLVAAAPSIAPDGRAIVVVDAGVANPIRRYVDLVTGTSVEMGILGGESVGWTPDGRYVLALSGSGLAVIDRTTATVIEPAGRLPNLSYFTLVAV
jgi:hypothetical protein